MDPAEAIDLVAALPSGSAYMGSLDPHLAWSDEMCAMADVEDTLWKLIWLSSSNGTTEGAPRVRRPWDEAERRAVAKRSSDVRETLENTTWEEVDHG